MSRFLLMFPLIFFFRNFLRPQKFVIHICVWNWPSHNIDYYLTLMHVRKTQLYYYVTINQTLKKTQTHTQITLWGVRKWHVNEHIKQQNKTTTKKNMYKMHSGNAFPSFIIFVVLNFHKILFNTHMCVNWYWTRAIYKYAYKLSTWQKPPGQTPSANTSHYNSK